MKLRRDARFGVERKRFDLRFTCEHCGLYDAARDRCAHGFPTAAHRECADDTDGPLLFCKDFELG